MVMFQFAGTFVKNKFFIYCVDRLSQIFPATLGTLGVLANNSRVFSSTAQPRDRLFY